MTSFDAVSRAMRVAVATFLVHLSAAVLVPLAPTICAADSDRSAATPKFVVYFGLDIATDLNGALCPVVQGGERDVQVLKDGRTVELSLRDAQLKTTIEPKLSRTQATLERLKGDRVYSPTSDPARDAMNQQMVMETAQSHNQEIREMESNSATRSAIAIERAAQDPMSGISQEQVDAAKQQATIAASNLNAAFVTPMFNSALPGMVDDNEAFDAFEVSFRLSATEEQENAYGVLRLLVRDPASPQRQVQTIKFFNVRKLGPQARRMTVQQMGLPPGFGVDSFEVHIYANGREIPTNLSSNRVELNQDEAHQFLILRHLQENRQASIPVQIIAELVPTALSEALAPGQAAINVNLAIDQNGRVTRILPTAGIPTTLGPELEAAIHTLRFLPALLNGGPVDSQGTFALSEFLP